MVALNKDHQCRQPPDDDLVDLQHACPLCGERHQDRLVWIDDQRVRWPMDFCRSLHPNRIPRGKARRVVL